MEKVLAGTAVQETTASNGRWKPGQSGNPAGRPPTVRGEIGSIQEEIERAVRKKITPERVIRVVEATFEDATGKDTKVAMAARKLIFEYFIQKPKTVEESIEKNNSVTIRIENATFKATHVEPEQPIIEGEIIEVKENG